MYKHKYGRTAAGIITAVCILLFLPVFAGCSELQTLMYDEQALYTYNNNGDGTAELTAYKGTETKLVIPDKIYDLTIVSVGESAFADKTSLVSVTFGESVTKIGTAAFFGCKALKSVNLGNMTEIGSEAFFGCASLEEADLGSAELVGEKAFYMCSAIRSVKLGHGKNILLEKNAFTGCSSMETLEGGESAKMEAYAFSNCSSLQSVTFSEKARLAGEVFTGCTSLYTAEFTGGELPQYLDKWVSSIPTFPIWTNIVYSEQYLAANRKAVYTDSNDKSRLFTLLVDGEGNDGDAVSLREDCPVDPCNGNECIDCIITLPQEDSVAGWQFMNACYDEEGHRVAANGVLPGGGSDLRGAQRLTFYAKTEDGGEHITFFFGGCGHAPDGTPETEFADSTQRVYQRCVMSDTWQRFSIDISQCDLSYIQCGFGFSCLGEDCGDSVELYLDDIYFEGTFS